jgi:hypothetical protein
MSWITQRESTDAGLYRHLRFVGGRILQDRELDDLQASSFSKTAAVTDALFKDGALINVQAAINGLNVTLSPIDAESPMFVIVDGAFEVFEPVTLTLPGVQQNGTDPIYLNWVVWRVTADGTYNGQPGVLSDPALIDAGTGESVAERGQLQFEISLSNGLTDDLY